MRLVPAQTKLSQLQRECLPNSTSQPNLTFVHPSRPPIQAQCSSQFSPSAPPSALPLLGSSHNQDITHVGLFIHPVGLTTFLPTRPVLP